MAAGDLTIEADEPGRLVLARAPAPVPGAVVAGFALAILAGVGLGLLWRPALFLAVVALVGGLRLVSGRAAIVRTVTFDRREDLVEVTHLGGLGILNPVSRFRPSAMHALRLEARTTGSAKACVRFVLREVYPTGHIRNADRFTVEGVRTIAQAGELGLRMARAAGLDFARTGQDDPHELTRDFAPAERPGFALLAVSDGERSGR